MTFLARIVRFLFWLLILSWSVALIRRIVTWMLRGVVDTTSQSVRMGSNAGAQTGVSEKTASYDARAGAGSNQQGSGNRRLVKDPVCGVHVAEVLAIPLREENAVVHFCSTACRDAYVANTKKFAASG